MKKPPIRTGIEQALDVLKQSDLYITFYFPDRLDCQAFLNVLEEPLIELEPEKASTLQFDFELRLLQEENREGGITKKILARTIRSWQVDHGMNSTVWYGN